MVTNQIQTFFMLFIVFINLLSGLQSYRDQKSTKENL